MSESKPKSRYLKMVYRTVGLFVEHRATRSAAAFAYFMTLSIFPILILINSAVGALDISPAFAELANDFLPAGVAEFLDGYIGSLVANRSVTLFAVAAGTAITSGSGAMRCIMRALEDVYDRRRFSSGAKNFLMSFVLSLCFLLAIYLGIVVVFTGGWFLRLLDRFFGIGSLIASWRWLRFLLMLGLVFFVLDGLYRAVIPKSALPRAVVPGALFSAVVFSAASILFSFFIGLSANYSLIYGSLASIAILMFWFYIVGAIVVLGGIVNYVWDDVR